MTKEELIDFRARLVRARDECLQKGSAYPLINLVRNKLIPDVTCRVEWLRNPWIWYEVDASSTERAAMWDNSIAHVDELIKGK